MAGEKITLEVVSKLVDKGFKLAKQQIEQIRKLEQKRFKQNVLHDTRALIAAKGNYKEEQRIISRMEDRDRQNTINRIQRARDLTNIKIAGIKKTANAFDGFIRKQIQGEKNIRRGISSRARLHKKWAAQKQAIEKFTQNNIAQGDKLVRQRKLRDSRERQKRLEREHKKKRAEDRKTAAEEIRNARIVDRVRKKVARDRIARTKRNEKAVRSEARKTAQVRRQALGGIKQGYSSIIGTLGQLTVAAGIAGYALVSAAKKVLSVGAGFEQSIVNVGAIANMTDQQMSRIGNKARELGAQTAYTATEVANGMADLARAGLKANDIMGAIGPTLYLAGAAGADMTQATKLMARTMAQFGLGAEHAANVADTFTLAMQNSLLDIESLDSSMRYAGAAAGAFGWDIQQTTGAVSLFMDQTGMGSTAGTQFRHVLLSLAGPTAAAQQVIKDLARTQGVTYKTMRDRLNPATSDFATILQNLKPIMQDHDKILKLVNKRSSGTLQKILKDYHTGQSKYNELTTMFAEGGGAALTTYDKQMGTVLGKQKIVASKVQEAMLQLFDAAGSPISKFLDSLMVMMDDVILVFDAMSANIQAMFHSLLQGSVAVEGLGTSAESMGVAVGAALIRTIQFVVWLISNLPKVAKNFISWYKPIFTAFLAVKAFSIFASITKLIMGTTKAVIALSGTLKKGAKNAKLMAAGMRLIGGSLLGLGVAVGSYFLADYAIDKMTPDLEDITEGTEEFVSTSTDAIIEHTAALRAAKEEYVDFQSRLGGGVATGISELTMQDAGKEIIGSTQDKDIRNAIIKQSSLSGGAVKEQVETGQLVLTGSDLISSNVKARLQEMAKTDNEFLVSLETIGAVAKSISNEEFENFKSNQSKKVEELLKYQSAVEKIAKIEGEGIKSSFGTAAYDTEGSMNVEYGKLKDRFTSIFDFPGGGSPEAVTKELRAQLDLMESQTGLLGGKQDGGFSYGEGKSPMDSAKKLYKDIAVTEAKLFQILQDQQKVMETVGDITLNERASKLEGIVTAISNNLPGEGEIESNEIKELGNALSEFYEKNKKFVGAEREIQRVLGETTLDPKRIEEFTSVIMEKLDLVRKQPSQIKKEFENLKFEDIENKLTLSNIVEDGILKGTNIDSFLKFKGEEFTEDGEETESLRLINLKEALQIETEMLRPLKQRMALLEKLAKEGQYTPQQLKKYQDEFKKIKDLIISYQKEVLSNSGEFTEQYVKDVANARKALEGLFTEDPDTTHFMRMIKDLGEWSAGQIETLMKDTKKILTPEEQAEQDRRNQEYINKLKAFYKKLFQMEKSQQQRLDKIREDESDSLANALKRRLDKTREFFEEGYRLLRNNTSRTIALRRREERLLNQIRLEERIKLTKATQKELEQVEGEIFKLKKTPYQQAVEKSRKDILKAQEDYQKAINLVAKTGSKERLEQVQRDSDKLRDITSKAMVGEDGKIKRYAPKVSSLNFARIGEPEYKKDTKKEDKKSRQQIFDDLLARRRQALLDNDEEGLKGINKEYQEQIKLQEESLKITNLYAALLEKRSISGKKIGKKDMVEFQGLSPKTIKDATRVVNAMGRKGIAEALDIAKKSADVRQSINSRNVLSFNYAQQNMTKALEDQLQLRDGKVRKAGLELTKWKEDNIYKPLEIMEKDITAVFETTQGDQTKREREEIKERLEEQLGGYDKALEELKVYDIKRRAIATKAMMDSDLGFDLRDDMSPMNASWWKTRRMELENELLSGPSLNSLFQRAFDVEMKALDTRTPEGAKERLLAEAESLRALAKLYREHEEEKRSIIKEYRLDEDDVSEEDLRIGQKQLALVTERQKKEMDAAKKAAKDAAAGIAHYFKVAGEKIGAVFNSAFGPIYAVYQFFQNILDITSSLIGKIKSGIDFFTGGNLELNPFTLMTEAANELLAHMDEIIEKQKALDEQYQAGRISQDEYKKNQEVLNLEKKNARAVAKETVDKMIDESIRFMDALIKVAPMIIEQLIKRLPEIMEALRKMVPMLGKIVDELFPVLVPVLTKLFTLAAKIFFQVLSELLFGGFMGNKKVSKKPGKKAVKAGTVLAPTSTGDDEIYKPRLFGDTPGPMKVMSSGFKKYGDTPGPVRVTNSGLLARFAPGDTVIAAKEPQEVMRQALMAVGSDIKMGVTKPPPMPSSATQGGSAGGSSRIDIAVIAEGRVLDAVQMQAMDRGHAPKIAKRLRKASGVKVGFNRGRYNKFAVNES